MTRKLSIAEQLPLLQDLTDAAAHFVPGEEVFVTLHPDHPPEARVLTIYQAHGKGRRWPDGQAWSAAQLKATRSQERHCPPIPVKGHTLNVTRRCAALPSGERLMAIIAVLSVLLCLLITPHLPGLVGKALWGAAVLTLLILAEQIDHLRGVIAYLLTARVRRCHEARSS